MKHSASLVVAIIVLIAAAALYSFLYFEISRAIAAATDARSAAATVSAQTLYQKSISGLLLETEDERTGLAAFILTDQGVPSLLSEIESAAKRENVSNSVGSVSVLASSWSYYEPLEVKLSARGSLAALAVFATDLESLPEVSHLSTASLQAAGNHAWFGAFTVDFVKEKTTSSGSAASSSPQMP